MKGLNEYIEEVEYLLEYSFENEKLLLQVLTRRSYSQENGGENNEVLELIGDRVLDYCVTKILMDRYGYIEKEEYGQEFHVNLYDDEPKYDEDGNPEWVCNCEVESEGYYYLGQASSKKMDKKKAAHCAICAICGLYNKYDKY